MNLPLMAKQVLALKAMADGVVHQCDALLHVMAAEGVVNADDTAPSDTVVTRRTLGLAHQQSPPTTPHPASAP